MSHYNLPKFPIVRQTSGSSNHYSDCIFHLKLQKLDIKYLFRAISKENILISKEVFDKVLENLNIFTLYKPVLH